MQEQVAFMSNQMTFGVRLIKTGLPVYGVFVALLTFLQVKALKLRQWRGKLETSAETSELTCSELSVAEQFSLFLYTHDLAFVDKTLLIGWVYQKHFPNYLVPG